jgi:hypothetical protein
VAATWNAWVLFCLLAANIAGCAPLSGCPSDPSNPKAELTALQTYFAPDVRKKYDAIVDPKLRRQFRDEVVYGQIRAYDITFKRFEKALAGDSNAFSIGTDLLVLGLNAAGAVTGASAALAAASAGIVGAKGAVDKDLFYRLERATSGNPSVEREARAGPSI